MTVLWPTGLWRLAQHMSCHDAIAPLWWKLDSTEPNATQYVKGVAMVEIE